MVTSTSYVLSALNDTKTEVVQVIDKTGTFRGIRSRNHQSKRTHINAQRALARNQSVAIRTINENGERKEYDNA